MPIVGTGIILYKKINNKHKFLALIPPENLQVKWNGTYDIPKGGIDYGESEWDCAVRECLEEAGIKVTKDDIMAGPHTNEWLTIWLAKCNGIPRVTPNPVTGLLEHVDWKWVDPSELKSSCYPYLAPFIEWGIKSLK